MLIISNKHRWFFFILDDRKMAVANKNFSQKSLEIKTKSIEATLVPLVTQISTLVNFKEKPRSLSTANEKTLHAINRVGDAVHMAVERFVSVGRFTSRETRRMSFNCIFLGESIANENPEIKSDLTDACREARSAGMCNNFS
jgi:hypothetical protein